MSLRIIGGPAGSGKTTYVVDKVVEELFRRQEERGPTSEAEPAIIVLVPDQATFQMERRILEDRRLEGFMEAHVLSFRRLCLKVLEETGGLSFPFITAVGKSMAIQSILWRRKQDLTVFAPLAGYPGFRDTLARALSELSQYDVSLESLSSMDDSGSQKRLPFLGQKIHDLDVVLQDYKEFIRGKFLDPDDYMELGSRRIHESSLVKGSYVFIDGFSGFTPKEYKVLRALLHAAREVNLALCIDEASAKKPPDPAGVFRPTRETYGKVMDLAWRDGISVEDAVWMGADGDLARFRTSPALQRVERQMRSFGEDPGELESPGKPADGVRIISAANPLAEVEFVAREITKLTREMGLRYRDITVETRDLTTYGDLISVVFKDYEIPFFLDQRRSLSHHPLAELIRSTLDVVTSSWMNEPVFRYLKTDLVPVTREEVDILENYVLAHGIVGERWLSDEPWRYSRRGASPDEPLSEEDAKEEADAAQADDIRRRAVVHLAKFYRRVKDCGASGISARDACQAILDLLRDLEVPETLARWQRLSESQGDLAEAADHAGVWEKTVEILTQAGRILGDQTLDFNSFALLVEAGLEDVRLGAIPPSLDQVLVGALDRSRQPECKVTFLMGALLGELPKRQAEDSIFTDAEREYLLHRGIEIEPPSSERQFNEKYLVYIGLTRPQERLYITYPLGDQEGKALAPSYVLDIVKRALPGLEEKTVSIDPPGVYPYDLDYVVPARVLGFTTRRLSLLRKGTDPGETWISAWKYLSSPGRSESCAKVLESLNYTNAVPPLDRSLVRQLYGHILATSVTRLETFAECPFWGFARDGLRLKERDLFKLEPSQAGVFIHAALKSFVDEVRRSGRDWDELGEEEACAVIDSVADRIIPGITNEIFLSSARYRFVSAALKRILRRAARLMLDHMKRGKFRPVAEEALFGVKGGLRPFRVEIPGGGQVLLRGQIDRVDIAVRDGQPYLRIVDYKSSPKALTLSDVYNGLALQLLVYLLVALNSWQDLAKELDFKEVPKPAGVLYFPVIDPLVRVPGPMTGDEALKKARKPMRMSGLIVGENEVARLMDETSVEWSDIVPVRFKEKGTKLGSSSSIIPRDDLESILDFVEGKVKEIAGQIFSGRVDIAPFRKDTKRACQWCPYGALCCFDIMLEGNRYRVLQSVPREDLISRFRASRTDRAPERSKAQKKGGDPVE